VQAVRISRTARLPRRTHRRFPRRAEIESVAGLYPPQHSRLFELRLCRAGHSRARIRPAQERDGCIPFANCLATQTAGFHFASSGDSDFSSETTARSVVPGKSEYRTSTIGALIRHWVHRRQRRRVWSAKNNEGVPHFPEGHPPPTPALPSNSIERGDKPQ
jgi:hypothetical protein